MARWDPGTEQRLREAALDLFREHGYDAVTVTQIAERAGITRRTYFRYFPDKREVLFGGADKLPPLVAAAVLDAEAGADALTAALAGLAEVGTQLASRFGERAAERRAVIGSSPELQERERTKAAAVLGAVEQALIRRGTAPAEATVIAQVSTLAFGNAWAMLLGEDDRRPFTDCLQDAVAALRAALRHQQENRPRDHQPGRGNVPGAPDDAPQRVAPSKRSGS